MNTNMGIFLFLVALTTAAIALLGSLSNLPPKLPPLQFAEERIVLPSEKPAIIALVFDDLGVNKRTQAVLDLPRPITASFLPDARLTPKYVQKAKERGHDVFVHMPMEAVAFNKDEPSTLYVDMPDEQVIEKLDMAFETVKGAIGLNNHTGSKFTASESGMHTVLEYAKAHNLIYLDSKTVASNVTELAAADIKYPILTRHVFLDHEETLAFVRKALEKTESIARSNSYAIAIGHPKTVTIEGVSTWLPEARNVVFMGVGQLYNLLYSSKK